MINVDWGYYLYVPASVATQLKAEYFIKGCIAMLLAAFIYTRNINNVIGIVILVMWICWTHKQHIQIVGTVCLLLICRELWNQRTKISDGHVLNYITESEVEVLGKVSRYSTYNRDKQVVVLRPYLLTANNVTKSINHGEIQININRYAANAEIGDQILVRGILKPLPVFNGKDLSLAYKSKNIYAVIDNAQVLKKEGKQNLLEKYAIATRQHIRNVAFDNLPHPHAELLIGMIIGSDEEFTASFNANLSNTGTSHVIAVSGYNITLIISTIMSWAGYLPRSYLRNLSAAIVLFFIFVVGLNNIPALRAGMMGIVVLIGMYTGRPTNVLNLLALAALIMIVQNPFVLYSLSFQLSFCATLGLIFLADSLKYYFEKSKLLKGVADELSVTVAANWSTASITLSNFGQVPIISLVANVLVAPIVGIVSVWGILAVVLYSVFPLLGKIAFLLVWALLQIFIVIINTLSIVSPLKVEQNEHVAVLVLVSLGVFLYLHHTKEHYAKSLS